MWHLRGWGMWRNAWTSRFEIVAQLRRTIDLLITHVPGLHACAAERPSQPTRRAWADFPMQMRSNTRLTIGDSERF
jgi:hypothetical protein